MKVLWENLSEFSKDGLDSWWYDQLWLSVLFLSDKGENLGWVFGFVFKTLGTQDMNGLISHCFLIRGMILRFSRLYTVSFSLMEEYTSIGFTINGRASSCPTHP